MTYFAMPSQIGSAQNATNMKKMPRRRDAPSAFKCGYAFEGQTCRLPVIASQYLFRTGRLSFFGKLQALKDPRAFAKCLAPLRNADWVVDG